MPPRRSSSDGSVKGPTSALTSFLKERGIRSNNVRSGFTTRDQVEGRAPGTASPAAGPSGTSGPSTPAGPSTGPSTPLGGISDIAEDREEEEEEDNVATPAAARGKKRRAAPAEEEDEEDEAEVVEPSTSKGKGKGKAKETAASKKKAAASKAAQKKKAKKDAGLDDDDSEDEEFRMEVVDPVKSRYGERKIGSFAMCAECNKKFTVTRYTNNHPEVAGGVLCGPCDKELGPTALGKAGSSAGAKPSGAKKPRAVKKQNALNKEKRAVMSLTKCCIEIIGRAINDVEEFGEIGALNTDKLCQIVCKNRDLTSDTVKLFLDVESQELRLYDCTRLEPSALQMLANYCPSLEKLVLNMCGFMDSETVAHYARRLTKLRHLQLFAAFLVTKEGWNEFFRLLREAGRMLEGFMIKQTPRIENTVVMSLVNTCPNLTHLQLAECGSLTDASLALLHPLKNLKYLDLSHGGLTGQAFTDDGIVPLLESVGSKLTTLVLDDNVALTDRTLIEGIKVNCTSLVELSLRNLGELLPTGAAELFAGDWVNTRGMIRLSLHRCTQLDDQALAAVVAHSGHTLTKLDLNSVDGLTEDGLKHLAENAPLLTELDLSFVRVLDDFLLKHLLDRLPAIKKVSIYGNNRVTDRCPSKAGVRVLGHEQGVVVSVD